MVTLKSSTTFFELQESIAREFNIPPYLQCIRYGFPPKELMPPQAGMEKEPVPLQHGDRITIEILKSKAEGGQSAAAHSAHTVKPEDSAVASRLSSKELQEQADKEMYSLCLLATLMGKISLTQMVFRNCECNILSFSLVFVEKNLISVKTLYILEENSFLSFFDSG